jgi:hypothetical protein
MPELTKLTIQKRSRFLLKLAECGNITRAAKAAKIAREYLYELRSEDKEFAKAWDEARAIGMEGLEDEAIRRAYEGVQKPIYQQATLVGTVTEYSDTLLIFLLKGGMPDKYKDRVDMTTKGKGINDLNAEQLDTRLMALLERARTKRAAGDSPKES